MLWKNFLEYFKFPKIAITLLLTVSIFSILQLAQNNAWVVVVLTVPISLISVYYNFKIFPHKIEIKPVQGKSFMILEYLDSINSYTGRIVQLPFIAIYYTTFSNLKNSNTVLEELAISLVLSSLSVLLYGYFFFLPAKIREYFLSNYSEFAQ
jgi:hypothetical protein